MGYELEQRKNIIRQQRPAEQLGKASRPEHDTANLQRTLGNDGVERLVTAGRPGPSQAQSDQVARDSLQSIVNRQISPGTVPAGTIQKMDGDGDDLSHLLPQMPNLLKRGNMARRDRRENRGGPQAPIANPPNNNNQRPVPPPRSDRPPQNGRQRAGNNTNLPAPPVPNNNNANIVDQAPPDRNDALEEEKIIKLLAIQTKNEQNAQTKMELVQRLRELGLNWIYKYRQLMATDKTIQAKMEGMERLVYEDVIQMETALQGQFNNGQVFNPNLGSGAMNTVQGIEYGGGERRVFKPAENQYGAGVDKAVAAGIPKENTRLANRNVAMSRLDQLFGTNVIAPTDFAMQGNKFGTAQQLAAGKAPQKFIEDPQMKEMMPDNPETWKKEHARDFDFSDPLVQKGMSNLALIDGVAGQIDRNWGNYFINQPGGDQQSQVTGIDNDLAFGVNTPARPQNFAGGNSFQGLGQFMDQETITRFMAITEIDIRNTLRPLLPPEEIEATVERWRDVRGQLEQMMGNNQAVGGGGGNPAQWGAETYGASTQKDAASSYLKTAADTKSALGQHRRVIGKDE